MNRRAASLESCRRYPRDLPRRRAGLAAVQGQLRRFALRKYSEPFRRRSIVKAVTDLPVGA
jgi:hypothetical protein